MATPYLRYRMKGNNVNPPYEIVVWTSFNSPDFTGAFSPVGAGNVKNVVIDDILNLAPNPAGYVVPTSPAGGDLDGYYPNPEVIGINGILINQAINPVSGQVLAYNGADARVEWTTIAPLNNFQPVINVKSYGAIGDGIVDDTIAVQTAINVAVATTATLYFPTGVYLTAALTINHAYGLNIRGERSNYGPFEHGNPANIAGSILKMKVGTSIHVTFTDCQDVTITNLQFYGANNQVDINNTGIHVSSDNTPASYYIQFESCIFSEYGTCVTWSNNPNQADKGGFRDCEFWLFTRYGLYLNSDNALDIGHIDDCFFAGAPGPLGPTDMIAVGIYVYDSGFIHIKDCAGGGILKYFIQINSSLANNVIVSNCESEGPPGTYQFYITGANDANTYTFIGNSIVETFYIGGFSRVVGIGNFFLNGTNGPNGTSQLILDGPGSKYTGFGDRFDKALAGEGPIVYITPNGGIFHNQDTRNANALNEFFTVGQITYQSTFTPGDIGEYCTRSGFRATYWTPNGTYAHGSIVQPILDNGHVYINNGSTGTSGALPGPSFNTGSGSTTTDNTITWTEDGYSAAFGGFAPVGHSVGTTPPSSGYYTQGSIVWNADCGTLIQDGYQDGYYVGWVCLAAGNPGTWVEFGKVKPPVFTWLQNTIIIPDADLSLSVQEAQSSIISFSGTLSNDRTITFPVVQSFNAAYYRIFNDTIDGYSIIINAGGTTVTIPNAVTMQILQVGNNFVPIFSSGQSRIGQLIDNTGGSVGSTIAAMSGTYGADYSNLNNDLASLAAKINALELIIYNLGITR